MTSIPEDLLLQLPLYRALSPDDRARLAAASTIRRYDKGDLLFSEGDPADALVTLVEGRVKIFRMTPAGKDVILAIFGPGDPVGAVAVYEERPYPASAMALEDTTCLLIRRETFFRMLEEHPAFTRVLLLTLTRRLAALTARITELGGRVEPRLARTFLALARDLGRPRNGGTFIPLSLSRQELADLTGTTIETSIRIMSRWGKEGIVTTEKDGFLVLDRAALE
ncbi:Crp/Fnr family transcriptional regulator, partial [bacterium]